MSDPASADADSDQPGNTRTWWHPLFARMLNHLLATAYSVEEEVLVGKLPLRVDTLLTRREVGELSEASRRELGALVPLLNRYTLIQFKGPTDTLQQGDLSLLIGYAFVWCGQQVDRIPQNDLSLIIVAPALNRPLRNELADRRGEPLEHERGVFCSALPSLVNSQTENGTDRRRPFRLETQNMACNSDAKMQQRVDALSSNFCDCLKAFDGLPPFSPKNWRLHLSTIARLKDIGLPQLLEDTEFFDLLYATVDGWIGPRVKLVDKTIFTQSIRSQRKAIEELQAVDLLTLSLTDLDRTAERIWGILDGIQASTRRTKLVSNSKTLHHLLPRLMPPIDRRYTLRFLYDHDVIPSGADERVFYSVFRCLHQIGQRQSEQIRSYVGRTKYHSSETKVIDNAIVAFMASYACDIPE